MFGYQTMLTRSTTAKRHQAVGPGRQATIRDQWRTLGSRSTDRRWLVDVTSVAGAILAAVMFLAMLPAAASVPTSGAMPAPMAEPAPRALPAPAPLIGR